MTIVKDFMLKFPFQGENPALTAQSIRIKLGQMQASFTSLESLNIPTIAAITGRCIGAGIDLIAACDIRICTSGSMFSIKEIDVGLAPDLGTIQRIPKCIGNVSLFNEYLFSCNTFDAKVAKEMGLVSRVFDNQREMDSYLTEFCRVVCLKPTVAVQTAKESIVFSRDHSVKEGLQHINALNGSMLQNISKL